MTNHSDIRNALMEVQRASRVSMYPTTIVITHERIHLLEHHEDGEAVVEGVDKVAQYLDDEVERHFDDGGMYRSMSQ